MRNFLQAIVTACLLAGICDCQSQPGDPRETSGPGSPSLHWIADSTDATKQIVEARGLDHATLESLKRLNPDAPDWQFFLVVRVLPAGLSDSDAAASPAMIGTYSVESGAICYRPRFPLEPGLTYRAVLCSNAHAARTSIVSDFKTAPRAPAPATVVSQVYPTTDVLPENLLKFYIYFSAPMRRGNVYQYIHLEDASGHRVELPFLELDEELWNPAMTRFTLYVDPGRIKRGVKPLVDMGPALEAGKEYLLRIDAAWHDAQNRPLKQESIKRFRVGPPDRISPDPGNWVISPPRQNTREPVIVRFPEPMEHALAERLIRVTDNAGQVIPGDVALQDLERTWTFIPDAPWRPGRHAILVEPTIEDLAGNNVGKLFDVDLVETPNNPAEFRQRTLAFEVR